MNRSGNSVAIAVFWMLLALCLFSLLAIGVKELTDTLNPPQILFYRNLLALLLVSLFISVTAPNLFKTKLFNKHLLRNISHFAGQYGWVYGIAFLPLAEVFALEFTTPMWTAVIAVLLLKEKLTVPRMLAVVLGFAGVLLILRPGVEIIHPASIAVLLGAAAYAITHVTTKSLSKSDTPLTIIFYMTLIQAPLSLLFTGGELQLPAGSDWGWVIMIALAGLLAHFAMTRALVHADAMVVVPIDYLRLPLIMLVGYLIYNETVDGWFIAGAILMISGNLSSLIRERKMKRVVTVK